ncbi:hypothetical protein FRC20_001631 [Serendipita sp. 405]|nr:hypothetical protein FRC20_001631 [Serendipita sp. 405]
MVENETGYQASTKQDKEVRRWNISADFSQIQSLRVFIHHGDRDLQDDLGLLVAFYHAPLLRALSIHISLYNPANPIPLSLTHLHLVGPLNALPQLQLPLLKFLHLSIEPPPEIWEYFPSTPFSFHSWSLPVLITLRLNGRVVEAQGELVRELVLRCSQTIVNLVLDLKLIIPDSYFNRIAAPLSIVYPVFHLCPRLAVLGLSMSFLMHSTPIPRLPPPLPPYPSRENHSQPSARSLSLLILGMSDFDAMDSKNRDKFDEKLTNSAMLSIFGREEVGYTPWSLARVSIPYTWSELGTFWDERHRVEMQDSHRSGPLHFYHPAEPAWAFLSHFIRKKLDIFDADGVELHAETGGGMALFKPFM